MEPERCFVKKQFFPRARSGILGKTARSRWALETRKSRTGGLLQSCQRSTWWASFSNNAPTCRPGWNICGRRRIHSPLSRSTWWITRRNPCHPGPWTEQALATTGTRPTPDSGPDAMRVRPTRKLPTCSSSIPMPACAPDPLPVWSQRRSEPGRSALSVGRERRHRFPIPVSVIRGRVRRIGARVPVG